MKFLRLLAAFLPLVAFGQTATQGTDYRAPQGADRRMDSLAAGHSMPFTTVNGANAATIKAYRYVGLVKHLKLNGVPINYSYQGGVEDSNLLPVPVAITGTCDGCSLLAPSPNNIVVKSQLDAAISPDGFNNPTILDQFYRNISQAKIGSKYPVIVHAGNSITVGIGTTHDSAFSARVMRTVQGIEGTQGYELFCDFANPDSRNLTYTGTGTRNHEGAMPTYGNVVMNAGDAFTTNNPINIDYLDVWFQSAKPGASISLKMDGTTFRTITAGDRSLHSTWKPNEFTPDTAGSRIYSIVANTDSVILAGIIFDKWRDQTKRSFSYMKVAHGGAYSIDFDFNTLCKMSGDTLGQKGIIFWEVLTNDAVVFTVDQEYQYLKAGVQTIKANGWIPVLICTDSAGVHPTYAKSYSEFAQVSARVADEEKIGRVTWENEDWFANGWVPDANNVHPNTLGNKHAADLEINQVAKNFTAASSTARTDIFQFSPNLNETLQPTDNLDSFRTAGKYVMSGLYYPASPSAQNFPDSSLNTELTVSYAYRGGAVIGFFQDAVTSAGYEYHRYFSSTYGWANHGWSVPYKPTATIPMSQVVGLTSVLTPNSSHYDINNVTTVTSTFDNTYTQTAHTISASGGAALNGAVDINLTPSGGNDYVRFHENVYFDKKFQMLNNTSNGFVDIFSPYRGSTEALALFTNVYAPPVSGKTKHLVLDAGAIKEQDDAGTTSEGDYIPTVSNFTNITNVTFGNIHYIRNGNTVEEFGSVTITPSSAGASGFEFTPSIASTFSAADKAIGGSTDAIITPIRATTSTHNLSMTFIATGTSAVSFGFRVSYVVQ